MRDMVLAMLVLVLALAGATTLEASGIEHTIWLTALVGGAGGLAGGVAMHLLWQAKG
jgi:shikimate 5-dehydrogenase